MSKYKYVTTLLSAIMLVLLGASCSNSKPLPEEYGSNTFELVNEKLGEDALTEEDYAQCIEWYEAAQNEYVDRFMKCAETSETMDDFAKNGEQFNEEWHKKWPQMEKLKMLLKSAKKEDMGEENMARFQKCQEQISARTAKVTVVMKEKFEIDLKAAVSAPADSLSAGKTVSEVNR